MLSSTAAAELHRLSDRNTASPTPESRLPSIPRLLRSPRRRRGGAAEGEPTAPPRTVPVNAPGGAPRFPTNYVSTTKYTPLTALPKFVYEQFTRFSNAYFLCIGVLYTFDALTPIFTGGRYSTLWTLAFVIVVAAIKDAWEDINRMRMDREVNRTRTKVLSSTGEGETTWARVKVADVVKIEKNEAIPADMLLLYSSDADGLAYIETKQLDGESNLKVKSTIPSVAEQFSTVEAAVTTQGVVECDGPNSMMYQFNGGLRLGTDPATPMTPIVYENFVLRGCTLRNTEFVYGLVINTGKDTKLMQNIKPAPVKTSRVERRTNLHYAIPLTMQFVMCIYLAIRSRYACRNLPIEAAWYLNEGPEACSANQAVRRFFTYFITFSALIPIALNVFIEIARVFHVLQVFRDSEMVDPETGARSEVRTSNLTSDLGQVSYIFSDKTGTLTANRMVFKKCSINSQRYQWGPVDPNDSTAFDHAPLEDLAADTRAAVAHSNTTQHDNIADAFFRVLSVCHAVVAEEDPSSDEAVYQSSSPDEVALTQAARAHGYKYVSRTNREVFLDVKGVGRQAYEVLAVLEFDSARKRMSVIVRGPDGKSQVLTKGADSVILARLKKQDTTVAQEHIQEFAVQGLRTLAIAFRELTDGEVEDWLAQYNAARSNLENREENIARVSAQIERDLTLVGITAIEDKLQDGVPDTLISLGRAGIKIWVLTGDKQETAINIGLSSGIFSHETDIIIINEEDAENTSAQIDRAIGRWAAFSSDDSEKKKEFGLVIDGTTVEFALLPETKKKFVLLGGMAKSVIGCRLSPKQKAELVQAVKDNDRGRVTLGIGDGANDVGMIRAADIGVGIVGLEGQEARLASDFSMGQFRFLKKLLLVHGRWFYKRLSKMALFTIYKNVCLSLNDFYWAHFNNFSGQPLLDPWMQGMYNLFFTALPPIAMGSFDQELLQDYALTFPEVYRSGAQNTAYNFPKFTSWMSTSLWHSVMIFFFTYFSQTQGVVSNGQILGMWSFGITVYFGVLWTVLAYILLYQSSWNWVTIVAWWLSVVAVFLFSNLFSLFAFDTNVAPNMHFVVQRILASSEVWLLEMLLIPVIACIPRLAFRTYRRAYGPRLKTLVQELRRKGLTREDIMEEPSGGMPSEKGDSDIRKLKSQVSMFKGDSLVDFSGFNYEQGIPLGRAFEPDSRAERMSKMRRTGSDTKLPVAFVDSRSMDEKEEKERAKKHRRVASAGAALGTVTMEDLADDHKEDF